MQAKDVAIVLLAAGNARRFGADKLMADFDGAPLGARVAITSEAARVASTECASILFIHGPPLLVAQ